jgi:hypothetical protein
MPLFNRVAELVVGQSGGKGILIENLRFQFQIEKTLSETLNNSTLKIYNLNRDSRKLVETANNAVILRAGYSEDIGPVHLFTGVVRRALTVRDSVDWITDLELDDGLLAYRDSKFTADFKPGAKGADVLAAVASKFGIPAQKLPKIDNKIYPNGWSFVGRSRDAMGAVCEYLGCEWSIQGQEVQVLKKGGSAQSAAALISPNTGMIGSPAFETKTLSDKDAAKQGVTTDSKGAIVKATKTDSGTQERLQIMGYKVKSLLQPSIQPGHIVKLEAEGINDFLKVEAISHSGDTFGSDWFSELSLRLI